MGSEERLAVAVAACAGRRWHVEPANALERLECLYGEHVDVIIQAVEVVVEALQDDLELRGEEALSDYRPPVSGVTAGSVRRAKGASLGAIARSWMQATSSLYAADAGLSRSIGFNDQAPFESQGGVIDRIPKAVLDYVVGQNPHAAQFFRRDLSMPGKRNRNHEVIIDYSGQHVVANFGSLQAGRLGASVGLIKRRLWDLKVDRDTGNRAFANRAHEMLIKMPDRNDPELSNAQWINLESAKDALEAQANQEEIRFEAFETIDQIGQRLLARDF